MCKIFMLAAIAFVLIASQARSQVIIQGLPQPNGKPPAVQDLEAELNRRLADAFQQAGVFQPRRPIDNSITWGGLRLNKVDANLRQQLGLDDNEGLVVAGVDANSPADKVGIKTSDVLVKINDKSVPSDFEAFQKLVKDQKVDQTADLVVVRQGKEQTLKGAKMPALVQNARPSGGGAGRPGMGGLGGLGGIGGIQIGRLPNPLLGNVENFHLEMTVNGVKTIQKYDNQKYSGEYSKEGLKITIAGKMDNGRPSQPEVTITEGKDTKKYETLKDVPAQHRAIIQQLMPSQINRLMLMPVMPDLRNFPGLPVIPGIDD